MQPTTFEQAKDEGMSIEVHWQDADSSSSNAVIKHFPDAFVVGMPGEPPKKVRKVSEN